LGILHLDTDHLGTPKAVYEHDTGEEIWHTEQDVYGKTQRSKTQRTHPKTGQAFAVNLRFQGQYEDVETGLYYNLNRYYDPSTGRYINHDPIGTSGGLNLYQYCPNPVEWIDPLGLTSKEECQKKYRALTEKQAEQALAGRAISPKNIDAKHTIQQHIDDGRLETQFNSLGSFKSADFYSKPNPKRGKLTKSLIIEVDISKIKLARVNDVSKGIDPSTGDKLSNPGYRFARKDKEVLIEGEIPPEAYRITNND